MNENSCNKTFEELEREVENCNTLDELFELWREAHKAEKDYNEANNFCIERESFIADGIVDKKAFAASPAAVLFILKESNIAKELKMIQAEERDIGKNASDRSQIEWYRNDVDKDGKRDNIPKQKEKMARMTAYILKKEKLPTEQERLLSRQSFAFLNLNKRGGGNEEQLVEKYFDKYYLFIKKQISLILSMYSGKRKYIVFLGTGKYPKAKCLISELKEDAMFISAWHPAYTRIRKNHACVEEIEDKNLSRYMNEFFQRFDQEID